MCISTIHNMYNWIYYIQTEFLILPQIHVGSDPISIRSYSTFPYTEVKKF